MKKIVDIHCSGLSRVMTCNGSLFFENLPESETNEAAREGTAFGELLERMLTGQPLVSHAKNGVAFNDEMKYHANDLATKIKANAKSEILCEQKIDWMTQSGIIIAGKYDISYVVDNTLYIDDAKYGYGIVEVKKNWQLIGYAIGEVIRRNQRFDKIVMRILQPRPHHEDGPERPWEITTEQLWEYKYQIENQMQKIVKGEIQLNTGSQCKYCPAAAEACTAFNRATHSSIDFALTHFQQDHISDKELSYQLDLVERAAEVLKIKHDSIKQLAVSRIKEGKIIPGYISKDSIGDRKWKSNISPKVIETLTGVNVVETIMLSPAKAEKLGIKKDIMAKFVERPYLGQNLVKQDANELGNKIFGTTKGEATC
jgi:hypothetical protein